MNRVGALTLAFGLVVAGLPAAAQGLCGNTAEAGQWIGGSEETSDIASAPGYFEQLALVLTGQDHVALFKVSAQSDVRVEAEARGTGDPVIELRNEAGDMLLTDDDSGGNAASRIEVPLAPGTYCVAMRSYDHGPMTGVIRVGLFTHEPLTEGVGEGTLPPDETTGCDLTAAVALAEEPVDDMLAEGVRLTGSAAELPFLSFRLAGDAALTITAENEAADPRITLYDEVGTLVAENDDHDGLNAQIDMSTPLWAGTYCLALSAVSDPALPITVTVKAYDAVAAQMTRYQNAEAAPLLDGSYPVTDLGVLESRLRTDIRTDGRATWFSLDVAEPGLIVIEAVTNEAGDPTLVLFDDLGRKIAFNDDSNGTLDSMIAVRVLPGTYLAAVRDLGERSDVPTRMVFERYVIPRKRER